MLATLACRNYYEPPQQSAAALCRHPAMKLTAHIRRLASDGHELYIRLTSADLSRCGFKHGQAIELRIREIHVRGVVKTSGATPWLAPGRGNSNRAITATLREAGFNHGDDVVAEATLRAPAA